MTGLLNLSLVWATIGVAGAAVLGLIGSHWGTAVAVLVSRSLAVVGSAIGRRSARAPEAGRYRHAAFDLYRHEILKQMALEIPEDAETERALWQRLTAEMVERIVPVPGVARRARWFRHRPRRAGRTDPSRRPRNGRVRGR